MRDATNCWLSVLALSSGLTPHMNHSQSLTRDPLADVIARMSSSLAAVSAFLMGAACLAPRVPAQDWPQWRGPDRTGHVPTGTRVPTALPAEPKVLWRLEVGQGLASPVVAAGRVFYFDNQAGKETLHAIQAADSREVWRAVIDNAFKDEQGPSSPRCTPR